MLLGPGGELLIGDSIRLETRAGNRIPNEQRRQRDDSSMAAAETLARQSGVEKTRSLSSVYNCFGMVFASRRTTVSHDHIGMILKDDRYARLRSVEEVVAGDLILYTDGTGQYSHVSVVISPRFGEGGAGNDPLVLSQWGADGEYFHRWNRVNPSLGEPTEFWTDRHGNQ